MTNLVDDGHKHDSVWLKNETILCTEPKIRAIEKQIYACVHCGMGMDIYDLEGDTND